MNLETDGTTKEINRKQTDKKQKISYKKRNNKIHNKQKINKQTPWQKERNNQNHQKVIQKVGLTRIIFTCIKTKDIIRYFLMKANLEY